MDILSQGSTFDDTANDLDKPTSFVLTCGFCQSGKEVCNTTLFKLGKWTSLTCTDCRTTKTSRQWTCPCRIPWISCAIHASRGFLCVSHTRGPRKRKSMFLLPTEGYLSNSVIPNDLSGSLSGTFVLPDLNPRVKRMRVIGGFTSQPSRRAPHLLQSDAVAIVKRMRLAEPLPLSMFLSSPMDSAASSSSAADHNLPVQIIPCVQTHNSSPVSEASDTIYDG